MNKLMSLIFITVSFASAAAQAAQQEQFETRIVGELSSQSKSTSTSAEGFNELLKMYKEAQPIADPRELVGGWSGVCRLSPVASSYYEVPAKVGTWLHGFINESKLYAGMITTGSMGAQPISYYFNKRNYEENRREVSSIVKKNGPVVLKNDEWVLNFLLGYHQQHRFKKVADGKIIAVLTLLDGPRRLRGVNAVCYWFKKFE